MSASVNTLPEMKIARARRHHITLLGLLILLIGLGVYGSHWYTVGRFIQQTDDAYVGGDITVLSAKVPGYIEQVLVHDNQQVKKGELLLKLDDRDYRAALAQAEGNVAAQRAQLIDIDATRHLQLANIESAKATIAAADAEMKRTRDDNQRYRTLVNSAAVSVQSREKADADYQQAAAGGLKARADAAAAERQLAVLDARTLQANAALEQALAQREMAQLNLRYTELRAPFDGTIGNRRARTGAYAATGSQLLAVVPAEGLWIDANFKESQLAHMQPGQRAEVRADVLPGRVFHGYVGSLSPATGAQFSVLPAENATGNFTKIVQRVPIRILLEGDGGKLGVLRPGLSVVVEVNEQHTR